MCRSYCWEHTRTESGREASRSRERRVGDGVKHRNQHHKRAPQTGTTKGHLEGGHGDERLLKVVEGRVGAALVRAAVHEPEDVSVLDGGLAQVVLRLVNKVRVGDRRGLGLANCAARPPLRGRRLRGSSALLLRHGSLVLRRGQ